MPFADKEKEKAWRREYYLKNKDRLDQYYRKWREGHSTSAQGSKPRECFNAYRKKKRQEMRLAIITFMGGKCVRCGFDDPRALQIDHINGGGCSDTNGKGWEAYGKLHKEVTAGGNEWMEKYQLLCANCNWIKRYGNDECMKALISRR